MEEREARVMVKELVNTQTAVSNNKPIVLNQRNGSFVRSYNFLIFILI